MAGFNGRGFSYLLMLSLLTGSGGLTLEFMESLCGTTYSFSTSFQLDASTGITYKNLLDCILTVTAPSGHFILAIVTRFELEAAVTGTCTDYLNVHNGSDTSFARLHTSELCGWGSDIPSNLTSSAESMTLRLVTDNTGVKFGFNIVFAAVQEAPCASPDFSCSNQLCVDASLCCDNYNQCGDNSDENNCQSYSSSSGINIVMVVVVTSVVVVAVAVVAAVVIYKVRDRQRWKKFVNSRLDDDNDDIVEPGASYPITHVYHKGVRGHPRFYTPQSADKIQGSSAVNTEKNETESQDTDTPPAPNSTMEV